MEGLDKGEVNGGLDGYRGGSGWRGFVVQSNV